MPGASYMPLGPSDSGRLGFESMPMASIDRASGQIMSPGVPACELRYIKRVESMVNRGAWEVLDFGAIAVNPQYVYRRFYLGFHFRQMGPNPDLQFFGKVSFTLGGREVFAIETNRITTNTIRHEVDAQSPIPQFRVCQFPYQVSNDLVVDKVLVNSPANKNFLMTAFDLGNTTGVEGGYWLRMECAPFELCLACDRISWSVTMSNSISGGDVDKQCYLLGCYSQNLPL